MGRLFQKFKARHSRARLRVGRCAGVTGFDLDQCRGHIARAVLQSGRKALRVQQNGDGEAVQRLPVSLVWP